MKKNKNYIEFEFIVDSRFDNNGNLVEMRKSIENLKNRLENDSYFKENISDDFICGGIREYIWDADEKRPIEGCCQYRVRVYAKPFYGKSNMLYGYINRHYKICSYKTYYCQPRPQITEAFLREELGFGNKEIEIAKNYSGLIEFDTTF